MLNVFNTAIADLAEGLSRHRVWVALASEDIGDQHRRTALGPIWLLVNYLAYAGTFIFIFHGSTSDLSYGPYVATGLLVWFYMMEVVTTSVTLFAREESLIKGTVLPLSVYVLRATLQAVIRAGYALVGCALVLMLSGTVPTPAWAWSVLGLLVILLATPGVIIVFAFTGVFFPDSQFIVSNAMRVGMFVTPVFWADAGVGGIRGAFYHYNPLTYFLDIVRVPILDGVLPLWAFAVCILIALGMWALALALLGAFRRRVALLL